MKLTNRIMAACLAATMVIGLVGCGTTATSEATDLNPQGEATVTDELDETLPTVTNLNADELALVVNGEATANLNVTADAENLPDGAQVVFTYAASNESITVDADGNVAAVSVSAVTPFVAIIAKYDADSDGVADSEAALATLKVKVKVTIDAEGIELSQTEGSIEVYPYTGAESDAIKLEAITLPEGASTTVVYTSSDESVALVSEDGTVTGVSAGEATITATSEEGFVATCEITVARAASDAQAQADAEAAAAAKAAAAAAASAAEAASTTTDDTATGSSGSSSSGSSDSGSSDGSNVYVGESGDVFVDEGNTTDPVDTSWTP